MGDWKYIRRYTFLQGEGDDPSTLAVLGEELYRLDVDPSEALNLFSAPPPGAPLDRLRAELLAFCADDVRFVGLARELQARRNSLEITDPETIRVLESLGY